MSLDDDALELLVVGDLMESLSQLLLGLGTRPQRELEAFLKPKVRGAFVLSLQLQNILSALPLRFVEEELSREDICVCKR